MATLKNHKITGTLQAAVNYITKDKKKASVDVKDIERAVAYAMSDKDGVVTYKTITTCLNCRPGAPIKDFERLIAEYGAGELAEGNGQTKDGRPVLAWHYIQSFDGRVDPLVAQEVGRKFAEEVFPGHPVVISTHTNTEHTHNHFIVCAWALDGHKWHQCNDAYREARAVSDRLCDEYGLGVIEHTREQKLVRWKDKEGVTHFYEPTDRKNAALGRRAGGKASGDRVGSYRDTEAYGKEESAKLSERETVKKDIGELLPQAQSYGHLLALLRGRGYTVKAERKGGGWLKYTVFTPPGAAQGVRDATLSKSGYYTRESLEELIAGRMREGAEIPPAPEDIPYHDAYTPGETDFEGVDENWRKERAPEGWRVVKRSPAERSTVMELRYGDRERKNLYGVRMTEKHLQYLLRIMDESSKALKVMEREGVYGLRMLAGQVEGVWAEYNAKLEEVARLEAEAGAMRGAFEAQAKAAEIAERMKAGGELYDEFQRPADEKALKECEAVMRRYGLGVPGGADSLRERVAQAERKAGRAEAELERQKERLEDLRLCGRVLCRQQKEYGWDTEENAARFRAADHVGKVVEQKTNERKGKVR